MAGICLCVALLAVAFDRFHGEGYQPLAPPDEVSRGWAKVEGTPFSLDVAGVSPLRDAQAPTDAVARHGATLVNMWGSWCGPCREEMPILERAAQATNKFSVLGISRDWREEAALDALEDFDVTFPNYRDGDDVLADSLSETVPYSVLPVSFLVVDGEITHVHVGVFDSAEQVRRDVTRLSGSRPE